MEKIDIIMSEEKKARIKRITKKIQKSKNNR